MASQCFDEDYVGAGAQIVGRDEARRCPSFAAVGAGVGDIRMRNLMQPESLSSLVGCCLCMRREEVRHFGS